MTNVGLDTIRDFVLSTPDFLNTAFDVEAAMMGGAGVPRGGSRGGIREVLISAIWRSSTRTFEPNWAQAGKSNFALMEASRLRNGVA